jgi:hypothetical protein
MVDLAISAANMCVLRIRSDLRACPCVHARLCFHDTGHALCRAVRVHVLCCAVCACSCLRCALPHLFLIEAPGLYGALQLRMPRSICASPVLCLQTHPPFSCRSDGVVQAREAPCPPPSSSSHPLRRSTTPSPPCSVHPGHCSAKMDTLSDSDPICVVFENVGGRWQEIGRTEVVCTCARGLCCLCHEPKIIALKFFWAFEWCVACCASAHSSKLQ